MSCSLVVSFNARRLFVMSASARSLLSLAAGAVLALHAAAPASAALRADPEFVSKVVRFQDLDIATASGAEALYGRIVSAARDVCRSETYSLARGCRSRAVTGAVESVGSPLLSSIHRSMTDNVEEVVQR
jgi:UrcA family protein